MNQMEMAMNYVRAMENNVSPNSVGKKSLTFIMDALKEKQKRDEESCKGEEQIYQYQNDWDECEWEGLGIEDDLISRRAMYIALNELGGCDAQEDYYKGYDSGIDAAISALQCAPTMGEEQVRHGKWIENMIFFTIDAAQVYFDSKETAQKVCDLLNGEDEENGSSYKSD